MAAAKPLYDLVLMLDSSAEDARRSEILTNVEQIVANNGGEVVNKQDWGARALAFEIGHRKDAEYHLLQFHATPALLSELNRALSITDEVVRFRIIKLAPGTPPPPEQRPEPRPGALEAEESSAAAAPQVEAPAYEPAPAGAFGDDA